MQHNKVQGEEELRANALGQQLRSWVVEAGGLAHPALQLSLATPHGRGLVATEPISSAAARQHPLIAVPERLLLTTEEAARRLGPALATGAAQQRERQRQRPWWGLGRQALAGDPAQLDPTLLLALLLASERRKGPVSYWWPYIAALPEDLPCSWALPPDRLAAALAQLGSVAEGWQAPVQAAAAAVQQRCEAAAGAYGGELGVSAADLRWALGHVVSRCFGSGRDLALLPLIDCCNHQPGAPQPQGFTSPAGQPCAAVFAAEEQRDAAAQAVPAGAEFRISYVAAGTSPLTMFLNLGFVG